MVLPETGGIIVAGEVGGNCRQTQYNPNILSMSRGGSLSQRKRGADLFVVKPASLVVCLVACLHVCSISCRSIRNSGKELEECIFNTTAVGRQQARSGKSGSLLYLEGTDTDIKPCE